jgi:hypothetical protein
VHRASMPRARRGQPELRLRGLRSTWRPDRRGTASPARRRSRGAGGTPCGARCRAGTAPARGELALDLALQRRVASVQRRLVIAARSGRTARSAVMCWGQPSVGDGAAAAARAVRRIRQPLECPGEPVSSSASRTRMPPSPRISAAPLLVVVTTGIRRQPLRDRRSRRRRSAWAGSARRRRRRAPRRRAAPEPAHGRDAQGTRRAAPRVRVVTACHPEHGVPGGARARAARCRVPAPEP